MRRLVVAAVAAGSSLLVDALLRDAPLTAADRVTRLRAGLVGICASTTLARWPPRGGAGARGAHSPGALPRGPVPVESALLSLAIVLDAVDGCVARRLDVATPRGASFDMEADAAAIAVLSLALAPPLGAWTLVPGSLRYAFAAAGRAVPALRGDLPPASSRRIIAGISMVLLAAGSWDPIPLGVRRAAAGVATLALTASFARDTVILLHRGSRVAS